MVKKTRKYMFFCVCGGSGDIYVILFKTIFWLLVVIPPPQQQKPPRNNAILSYAIWSNIVKVAY